MPREGNPSFLLACDFLRSRCGILSHYISPFPIRGTMSSLWQSQFKQQKTHTYGLRGTHTLIGLSPANASTFKSLLWYQRLSWGSLLDTILSAYVTFGPHGFKTSCPLREPPPPLWGQCPRFRNHNPSNKRHTHVGLVTDTCWHGLSSISAPTFGSLLWYQRLSWAHYPARCYPLWSPVDLMPFYYLPPIFIRPWFDVMDIEDPLFKHVCYFNPWAYIGRATVYFRGNVFYVYFDILKFLN